MFDVEPGITGDAFKKLLQEYQSEIGKKEVPERIQRGLWRQAAIDTGDVESLEIQHKADVSKAKRNIPTA